MKAFTKQNTVVRTCGIGMQGAVDEMAKILEEDRNCQVVLCEVEGVSLRMVQGETKQQVYSRFSELKSASMRPVRRIFGSMRGH